MTVQTSPTAKEPLAAASPPAGEPLTAALLRELLATPAVAALLLAGRPSGAAEAAPGVVRTLLWQDVNISLSLAKDLPQLANALFSALETLGAELGRFPDPVLRGFTSDLGQSLDLAAARRAAEAWGRLALRLAAPRSATSARTAPGSSPREPPSLPRALSTALLAPALRALSAWLHAHPDGLRSLARELLEPLPPAELRLLAERAAEQLTAVCKEHPALSEALARLAATLAWEAVQGSLRALGGRLKVGSRRRPA